MLFFKKQHQYLIIVLLLCGNLIAVAQEPKKTIIDFSKGGKASTTKPSEKADAEDEPSLVYRNAIMVDALSAVSGFPSISYERAITNKLSVAAGIGLTFTGILDGPSYAASMAIFSPQTCIDRKAYWESIGHKDNNTPEDFLIEKQDISPFDVNKPVSRLGNYFFLDAKYFFEDEVFDGLYVGARAEYMKYNYEVFVPIKGPVNSDNLHYSTQKDVVSKIYTDFIPTFGIQRSSEHFMMNYEFGVGVRSATVHGYDTGFDVRGNNLNQDYRLISQTTILPTFLFAYKIGYIF